MKRYAQAVLSVMLSALMGSNAFAIGAANIGDEVLSARAAGQGYVGVAGENDDPSAVYANPAAITHLKGTQATFGAHFENIHGSFESDSGQTTKARVENAVVPNVSVTQSFMDGKVGAGLTVQSPFGLETHWPGNGPMRYVATDSRLNMVTISPVIAVQLHPMVSVGAGPDYIDVFNAQLDKHVSNDILNLVLPPTSNGAPDAVSSLRGQGSALGYHAGIQITPNEQHSLGITYHSKNTVRINGNVKLSGLTGTTAQAVFGGSSSYETSAFTDIYIPENVQMGYAFKPSDKWMFEADAAWYHWSNGRDLNVRYAETDPTRLAFLNAGNPAVFDLRDAWSFATGVNYKVNDRWQVRGGFWYEPWAIPEQNFNPAFLDLSRYGISTGFGYALTKNLGLDFAYTAVFFHHRHINNNQDSNTAALALLGQQPPSSDGTYKDFANLVALNFTYRFGAHN
jgi:long-chain fatty acid transport protein